MNKLFGKTYNLAPFTLENISEEYIGWLNNPIVNQHLEISKTNQTIELVSEYIDKFYNGSERYFWGIYTKEGKLIGTINLDEINRYHNVASTGIMIGNLDYWGKRVAKESIHLVLNFAFNILLLKRVWAGTYSTNLRMNSAFAKLGFTCDGVLKQAIFNGKDQIDKIIWRMLSHEWNNEQLNDR